MGVKICKENAIEKKSPKNKKKKWMWHGEKISFWGGGHLANMRGAISPKTHDFYIRTTETQQ